MKKLFRKLFRREEIRLTVTGRGEMVELTPGFYSIVGQPFVNVKIVRARRVAVQFCDAD